MNLRKYYRSVAVFIAEEDGPTAVEYAVMLGLIIMVAIGSVAILGEATKSSFEDSADTLEEAFTS